MVRTRRREAWDHTSWLCAVIANHSFGAKKLRRPRDFNPLAAAEAKARPVPKLTPQQSMDLLGLIATR